MCSIFTASEQKPQALDAAAFAYAAPAVCAGTKASTQILTMLQALYRAGTLDAAAAKTLWSWRSSHTHAQVRATNPQTLEEWVQAGAPRTMRALTFIVR